MNWEAVTAIGETLGAVAVVASLVYVATQISLANRISVREARAAIVETIHEIYRLPLEHPHVAALEVKLQSNEPTLTPEEVYQAEALVKLWITFLSKVNGAHESGLLPDRVYEVYLDNFSGQLVKQPGLIPYVASGYDQSSIRPGDFDAHDRIFSLLATYEDA